MSVDAFGVEERNQRTPRTVTPVTQQPAMDAGRAAVQGPTLAGQVLSENIPGVTPGVAGPVVTPTAGAVPAGTPAAPAGMSPDEVQKLITDALSAQQLKFETQMKAMLEQQQQFQQQQVQSQRRSAYDVMRERFASYGLTSLADELTAILKGEGVSRTGQKITDIPTTSQGFYLALTETKAYYDRFGAVNEQRIKEGYTALDEKTILGLEDQYQQVMKAYNAPPGFYDQPEDFQIFLRYNKSKAEVADTMQAYSDFVQSTDPNIRQQLKDFYGIDDASLTAYYADPEKGQKVLDNIAARNLNTAAALSQGLSAQLAQLASGAGAADLSYQQQKQKYGAVAQGIQFGQRIQQIYGEGYTAEQAVAAEFGADQAALASQRRAARRELAEFQGQAGIGTGSLGTRTAGLI